MVKNYSEIQRIDNKGIIFCDGTSILFEECIGKRNYSNICVAERNIISVPPYFDFLTDENVRIVFNKKGLFSKNKNEKDFNELKRQLEIMGYSTYDLS